MIFRLVTCWWSAQRLDRYLDADPSAALSPREVERLERHLRVCQRCLGEVESRRDLRASLGRVGRRRATDPAALARLEESAARLRSEGPA